MGRQRLGSLIVAAGFLLALRIGAGSYAATVLPALLTIALGMASVTAPLTTAALSSVDERHTGIASGFNSAVARGGGLVATAMLGVVLTAQGRALPAPFHAALLACTGSESSRVSSGPLGVRCSLAMAWRKRTKSMQCMSNHA